VVIDDASRYVVVVPVADESGASAAHALEVAATEFAKLGIRIERVLTDNGCAYTRAADYRAVLTGLGIGHRWTRPYRPQTKGKDVHLCQAASSARSGMNSVPALSIAQRTRSFVRARAMIAWWWDLPSARLRS
jgi:Integrase core domain